MSEMDKIQILLATYNGERFLEQQLESIINQTHMNWELIIHDDGSTDKTIDIILRFCNNHPTQIKLLNDGVQLRNAKDNFGHLIKNSTANYIAFSDQDDIWLPQKLELCIQTLRTAEEENNSLPIIVHSDLTVVDNKGNLICESLWKMQKTRPIEKYEESILVNNFVTGCTMLCNRRAIENSTPIPPSAIMHDWWITLKTLQSGGRVISIDKPLVLYRQHDQNTIGAQSFSIMSKLRTPSRIYEALSRYRNMAHAAGIDLSLAKAAYIKLSQLKTQKTS